jgi:hypothetical protein
VNWNKLKSLFVVQGQPGAGPASSATDDQPLPGDLSDIDPELAKYLVPEEPAAAAPPPPLPASADATQLTGTIDFQGLYDQAGIPNTDEVEALEKFLGGLDQQLPQASRLAAAKAFLGAIGKSPADVLTDAERKIQVVRAVDASKQSEVSATVDKHQQIIDELQRQIEEQRAGMEAARRDLEAVRGQCAIEEARLQGARLFFGAMDSYSGPGTPGAPAAPGKPGR